MNHRTSTAGSARRVHDLKLSTVYPRAVPSLRLQDNNPPNLAEKIIEASQDLNNLGVSVLGSNDDATLLAEVGLGGPAATEKAIMPILCSIQLTLCFFCSTRPWLVLPLDAL
jgi:hypothetical protein